MLRLNRLTLLLLACCCYLFSTAQSTSCTADFTYSVENNNLVDFFAKDSIGTNNHWLFGDGSPVLVTTSGIVSHQYAQAGTYEVKHFIERPNSNCHDSIVKLITVTTLDECSASFYFQKDSSTLSYHFFNSSLSSTGIKKMYWSFGDGTVSDLLSPVHTFAGSGSYNVCLHIESNNGCTSEHCQQLQVIDSVGTCALAPYYQYHKIADSCKRIYFTNVSGPVNTTIHYTWNFGDGTTSHDLSPVHDYASTGKYYVCLVAEAGTNCRKEYCDSVSVGCDPCEISLAFTFRRDSLNCKKLLFQNQSAHALSNTHFIWNFGDGTTSNDINPSHVYNQTGVYRVCLVSETGSNCRKEFCDSVTVGCEPCDISLAYTYRRDSLNCKKLLFQNQSVHVLSNTHFIWNFGDGGTSNDINPSHIYNQTGVYPVCLVSETGSNCRKQFCDTVIVHCEDSCHIQPAFSWKKEDTTSNTIDFTNLTITSSVGAHYNWQFGDGTSSHDVNPTHVYAQPGVYTVCLVVETNNCRKEICEPIEIRTCNVTAHFEKLQSATSTNTVYFNNDSKPVNNIWQTSWSYGDGASSHDYNSFHKYDKGGVYNVCLTLISLNGCSSKYCDTVQIAKTDTCAVNANFSHYISSTNSSAVKFEALYQSNTAEYNWYFGDSSAGVGRIAYHIYNKSGKYNVCLTVKDNHCSTTFCQDITIDKPANGGRVVVYPNPAVNTVSIDVNLDRPGQLSIRFLDGSGAVRGTFSKNGAAGSNHFILPIDKLSQGIYLVEIRADNGTWFSRFVKG